MSRILVTSRTPWFLRHGYLQGVFWITLVALTSNLNDILMRLTGRLPAEEITFFRYFFATVSLIPFIFIEGIKAFKTERLFLHLIRAAMLFGAIFCWSKAVSMVPLAVVSTVALTVPIFVLPMAKIFLNEHIGVPRTLATLTGFGGIFIVIYGTSQHDDFLSALLAFNNGTFYLIIAAVLFAASDIVNKKFVSRESNLSMLFYIALFTAIIGFYPAVQSWITPSVQEFIFLGVLGIGGNLILFFLLKAFSATDVSALAPYRYTELIFAGLFGYILFREIPSQWTLMGSMVIVAATASITYYELVYRKEDA